jgi:hypothetical protein
LGHCIFYLHPPPPPPIEEPKLKEFPWESPNFKANLQKFQRISKKNEENVWNFHGRVNNEKEIPKDRIKISKESSKG